MPSRFQVSVPMQVGSVPAKSDEPVKTIAAASTNVIVFEKRFTIFLLGLSNANLLKTIP